MAAAGSAAPAAGETAIVTEVVMTVGMKRGLPALSLWPIFRNPAGRVA